ncbi:AsmA family protein [Lutibaculum baratangense]|uniref:AsmA domain-containing protein n=1 Tax=Lutibaculum baratangense AMV1 TaxID=631454 RepID=V4RE75_9HYPH|nr:AsmA family protein [Lutibaculum baratangense]ESR23694.1 hypothetical protein N177_2924 [Lutibaculum baratangense AMV1]
MALLRRLIFASFGAAFVLAVLLAVVSVLVSPEAVRARVVGQAAELTGLETVVRGRTRLSLFPHLRFELDDVAFLGKGGGQPIATADRLVGEFDAWKLLTGRLSLDTFTLVRPRVALVRAEDGTGNWEAGAGGLLGRAARGSEEAAEASRGARIGRLRIEDGRLAYHDEGSGLREEMSALSGKIVWPRLGRALESRLSGVWRGEIFNGEFSVAEPLRLLRKDPSDIGVRLDGAGTKLVFDGQASLVGDLLLDGTVDLTSASLRNALKLMGRSPDPGPGLNEIALRGRLHLIGGSASLSDAEVMLDGNRGEGTLELALGSDLPMVRGTLAYETVDLNEYRRGDVASLDGDRETAFALHADLIPDFVDALAFDVRISAARVLLGETALGRTAATLTSRRQALMLGVGETEVFGGIGAGTLNLTTIGGDPKWDFVIALDDMEVQPLLLSLGAFDALRGRGSFRFNGNAEGATAGEILQSLRGRGALKLVDGSVSLFDAGDLAEALRSGRADALVRAGDGTTSFRALSIPFTVSHGVVSTEELRLDAGEVELEGAGVMSLPQATLDARAVARLLEAEADDAAIAELPLVIRGKVSSPRIYPSADWLLEQVVPRAAADPIAFDAGALRGRVGGVASGERLPLRLRAVPR